MKDRPPNLCAAIAKKGFVIDCGRCHGRLVSASRASLEGGDDIRKTDHPGAGRRSTSETIAGCSLGLVRLEIQLETGSAPAEENVQTNQWQGV
jgi:hypothetical protein